MPYLEIYSSNGQVERVELTEDVLVIGRSGEADIQIPQPKISSRHARLKRTRQGRWLIKDMGSRNRTFYNGQPIVAHLLNEGDTIYLADVKIIFHDPSGASNEVMDYTIYRDEEASDETQAGMSAIPGDGGSALAIPSNRSAGAQPAVTPIVYTSAAGLAMDEAADSMNAGAEEENPLNMETLKRILRYKKTILITFAAIAVPAIIVVWALVQPKYTAEAQIRVRPIIPRLVFNTDDNGQIPLYDSYKNTQAAIILSPKVLERVLDRPEVQQTEWYKGKTETGGKKSALPLERLMKAITIEPAKGTEIINVTMSDPNGREATLIVNAVLEEYIKFSRENTSETKDFLYTQLSEEMDSLGKEIDVLEKITARLRKELGTGNPEELVAQKRIRLDEAQAKLDEIDQEIDVSQWQIGNLEKQFGVKAGESPTTQGLEAKYGADPEWRKLNYDYNEARKKQEMAEERLGARHRTVIDLRSQTALAEEMLRVREGQLDQQPVLPAETVTKGNSREADEQPMDLDTLKRKAALLKYRRNILADGFKKQKTDFDQTFSNAQLLVKENEDITHKRELYDKVRASLDQREMEGKVPGAIEIIARAIEPTEPDKDRRLPLTAASLFGALFGGMALAFMRTKLNPIIQDTGDLSKEVRAPFLGQIPLLSEMEMADTNGSVLNEYVRMVRTSLLYRLDGHHGNAIVITSANQGAGKTTFSLLLAQSLAQCGKKVLLVDGDLRNPNVVSRLGIKEHGGLLSILAGQAGDKDVILTTKTPGLSVLPAGRQGSGQSEGMEFIANGEFSACLDRWRRNYDLVLLDSSPVLPVADARILSRQADGTVFVVREGHCQREDVVEALASLGAAGGKLLGIVYAGSHERGGYSHYGYAYGYGASS